MLSAGRLIPLLFPDGLSVPLTGGLDVFVPPDPHFIGYIIGHDEHIAEAIKQTISPGDVAVDVGANIGYFSMMMAGLAGTSGKIITYEPEVRNFHHLELNAFHASTVGISIDTVNAACGEREGSMRLSLGSESTLHMITRGVDDGAIPIRAVTLSADLPRRLQTNEVRLLKIDVEGYEVEVLTGAEALIRAKCIEHILVEVFSTERAREVMQLLSVGYEKLRYWTGTRWQSFENEFVVQPRELWFTRT